MRAYLVRHLTKENHYLAAEGFGGRTETFKLTDREEVQMGNCISYEAYQNGYKVDDYMRDRLAW